jgi:hypothetical protein
MALGLGDQWHKEVGLVFAAIRQGEPQKRCVLFFVLDSARDSAEALAYPANRAAAFKPLPISTAF